MSTYLSDCLYMYLCSCMSITLKLKHAIIQIVIDILLICVEADDDDGAAPTEADGRLGEGTYLSFLSTL